MCLETEAWLSEWLFCYMFSNTLKNLQLHSNSLSQIDSQGTPREAVEFLNIVALTKTDKCLSFFSIFGNKLRYPSSNLWIVPSNLVVNIFYLKSNWFQRIFFSQSNETAQRISQNWEARIAIIRNLAKDACSLFTRNLTLFNATV